MSNQAPSPIPFPIKVSYQGLVYCLASFIFLYFIIPGILKIVQPKARKIGISSYQIWNDKLTFYLMIIFGFIDLLVYIYIWQPSIPLQYRNNLIVNFALPIFLHLSILPLSVFVLGLAISMYRVETEIIIDHTSNSMVIRGRRVNGYKFNHNFSLNNQFTIYLRPKLATIPQRRKKYKSITKWAVYFNYEEKSYVIFFGNEVKTTKFGDEFANAIKGILSKTNEQLNIKFLQHLTHR